jgi:hypothetical protein
VTRDARFNTNIWDEPSFRASSSPSSTPTSSSPCSPTSPAPASFPSSSPASPKPASDLTEATLRKQLRSLHKTRHLVVDEKYGEIFVRTYIRWDGLLTQPYLVANMCRDYHLIGSPTIRTAVLKEVRRLWHLDDLDAKERAGLALAISGQHANEQVRSALTKAGPIGPAMKAALAAKNVEAFADPYREAIPEPFREAFSDPYGEGTINLFSLDLPPSSLPAAVATPPPAIRPANDAAAATKDVDEDQATRIVVAAVNGHASAGEKRKLAEHVRQAMADGATQEHAISALREWTTRDKPQPGLLPSLLGDAMRGGRRGTTTVAAVCRFCMRQVAAPSESIRASVVANSPADEVELAKAARWWAGADPVCDTAPDRIHVPGEPQAGDA